MPKSPRGPLKGVLAELDLAAPRRANRFVVSRDLNPKLVPLTDLRPLGRATRKHPPSQIKKLARSLEAWGFVLPVLIDQNRRVVAGWGLVLAARQLGEPEVPAVTVTDLKETQLRALRQALNRLGEDSTWDPQELALEFSDLLTLDPEFDLTITGFEMGEIDVALDGNAADEEDELPDGDEKVEPRTQPGDMWQLGDHVVLCGDAAQPENYASLLGQELAQLVVADPPYNVPIPGHVSGHGAVRHKDFQMACGEMPPEQFTTFLKSTLGLAARFSIDGAIHLAFMDWRHQKEILEAGGEVYRELVNLCVWNKSNAGMGALYRSKHEFIYVFKKGTAPHINNVQLGRFGRHRSNVWDYPSQNTFNRTAKSKLSLHPTVKPVALVADAIRDCSNRGGLILDPFGGAGTTLIAAEKTGRRARLIEIEPRFVDVTFERWQRLTGQTAVKVGRK